MARRRTFRRATQGRHGPPRCGPSGRTALAATGLGVPLQVCRALAGEARDRPPQRRGHRPADGEDVDGPGQRVPLLELVLELEADGEALLGGGEGDAATAAEPLVLHGELLPRPRLVGDDALDDAAAPA